MPLIEPLEARIAPANFLVTSLLDDLSGGTLREAVDAANADPAKADTITFQAGLNGTILLDPAKNGISIEGPVAIKGPGIDKITVSGAGTTRAFFIQDNDPAKLSAVSISNLSIIGGSGGTNGGAIVCFEPLTLSKVAISGGSVNSEGGGLWVETVGKVTITDSKFLQNTAGSAGGGMMVKAAGGIVLARTVVSGNEVPSAVSLGGGAVLDSLGAKGSIKISDGAFTHNDSGAGAIGGLRVRTDEGRPIAISKTTVAFNTADAYGGLYCAEGALTLTNSLISHNEGTTSDAGLTIVGDGKVAVTGTVFAGNIGSALTYAGGGPLNVNKSQFLGNSGAVNGSALIAGGFGIVTVSGSLFSGNSATGDGGAIYFTTSTLILKGDIFVGNSTLTYGGALAAEGGGTVSIAGGSFRDNSASLSAGAILAGGVGANAVSLSIKGTIFQQNSSVNFAGAIGITEDAVVKISAGQFLQNSSLDGGAVGIGANTQTTEITGSLFRGNIAEGGGGGIFFNTGNALVVSSSRFFDNQANGAGGGAIYTFGPPGTVTYTKLTVIGNSTTGAGGGLLNNGAVVTVTSSILTGNFAPTGPNTSGV